jgi:hypothetical protein
MYNSDSGVCDLEISFMSKIDFAKAKEDIAEIVSIVKTVPEAVQEKCFELLFAEAFKRGGDSANENKKNEDKGEGAAQEEDKKPDAPTGKKPHGNVLVFMRRYNISEQELGKLFMLEHDPLLPVYKIPTSNMAKAQLSKCLMVLLENGLLNNAMTAPYAELRANVKDDGFYDGNFNKVLKRNSALFRGAISEDRIDEGGIVELTADGLERLAELIRELGQ